MSLYGVLPFTGEFLNAYALISLIFVPIIFTLLNFAFVKIRPPSVCP